MHTYYCWITAVLPEYKNDIITGLVDLGYMVGPANVDGSVSIKAEGSPSILFALALSKHSETSAHKIYDDVIFVLNGINAYYYSIVISASSDIIWDGSNVNVPDIKANLENKTLGKNKLN